MIRHVLVDRWRRMRDHVVASTCLLCRARGSNGRDLCAACAADFVRNRHPCPRCALPLAHPAPACVACLERAPPFDAAHAPFQYGAPLDALVMRFKFGRDLAAGRVLAERWADALAEDAPSTRPALLLPVPLHASRLRERGFNQALELARPIARALGIDCEPERLVRTRATEAQSGLDARARRRNVRAAFAVAPGSDLPAHVALVDDVMTTGATQAECARVLKRAGVERVDAWAFARAARS